MDHCLERFIGLVGTQGDAFELFEFHEEIFDQVAGFVDFRIEGARRCGRCAMQIKAPRAFLSAMIQLRSKALPASSASKRIPSIRGAAPTVSKRWPGSGTTRTRFPRAAVNASILVVQPPFDLPVA